MRNRLESIQFQQGKAIDYSNVIDETIEETDQIVKTFNALLSIARVESGVHREDWQEVNISNLIQDLGELYSVVAEDKHILWSQECENNLILQCNKQLLAQLITNLLDNAVKYTPPHGAIKLKAYYKNIITDTSKKVQYGKNTQANHIHKKGAQYLIIEVYDNGPGIPESQYEQVFKRFHRLDNARSSEGNGLGLSLVKAVTEMHEGSITLSNNQPGLKATLSLPC